MLVFLMFLVLSSMSPFNTGGEKHLWIGNGCSEAQKDGGGGCLVDPYTFQPSTFLLFHRSLLFPASSFPPPRPNKKPIVFGPAGACGCRLSGFSEVLARPRTADRCWRDCPSAAALGLLIGEEPRHSGPARRLGGGRGGRVGEGLGQVTSRHQEARLWF